MITLIAMNPRKGNGVRLRTYSESYIFDCLVKIDEELIEFTTVIAWSSYHERIAVTTPQKDFYKELVARLKFKNTDFKKRKDSKESAKIIRQLIITEFCSNKRCKYPVL